MPKSLTYKLISGSIVLLLFAVVPVISRCSDNAEGLQVQVLISDDQQVFPFSGHTGVIITPLVLYKSSYGHYADHGRRIRVASNLQAQKGPRPPPDIQIGILNSFTPQNPVPL